MRDKESGEGERVQSTTHGAIHTRFVHDSIVDLVWTISSPLPMSWRDLIFDLSHFLFYSLCLRRLLSLSEDDSDDDEDPEDVLSSLSVVPCCLLRRLGAWPMLAQLHSPYSFRNSKK